MELRNRGDLSATHATFHPVWETASGSLKEEPPAAGSRALDAVHSSTRQFSHTTRRPFTSVAAPSDILPKYDTQLAPWGTGALKTKSNPCSHKRSSPYQWSSRFPVHTRGLHHMNGVQGSKGTGSPDLQGELALSLLIVPESNPMNQRDAFSWLGPLPAKWQSQGVQTSLM